MNNPIVHYVNKNNPFNKSKQSINYSYYEQFLIYKRNKLIGNINQIEHQLNQFNNTIKLINQKIISNPNNKNRLLVVGQIQSGKTDFILGLISILFDQNVNFHVFVTTSNNKLLNQNYERVKLMFSNNSKVIIYNYKDLKRINISLENSSNINSFFKPEEKYIICLMKNVKHLESLNKLLNLIKTNQTSLFNNYCFYDDEADVASFNNIKKTELTAINKNITEFIDNCATFAKVNYIAITASAYAHVLYSKFGAIKPQYAYYLNPANEYVNIDYFNNQYNKKDSNVINLINDEEIDNLDTLQKSFLTYMFICCEVNLNNKNKFPRMIINRDYKNASHSDELNRLNNIIDNLNKNNNLLNEFKPIFIKEKLEINLYETYLDYIKNVIMKKIKIYILNNSTQTNNEDEEFNGDKPANNQFEIIIGCRKINRGITFIDLYVILITQSSNYKNNADNILQSARWLGYREQYKDQMRIFISEKLLNYYFLIEEINEYLIDKIIFFQENDYQFSLIEDLKIKNPNEYINSLQATRETVAGKQEWTNEYRNSYYCSHYWVNNNKQNKSINLNNQIFLKFIKEWNHQNYNFDQYNYPSLKFDDFNSLNKQLLKWNNNQKEISKNFNSLCELNDSNIINKIVNNSKYSFIVRLIDKSLNENLIHNEKIELEKLSFAYQRKLQTLQYNNNEFIYGGLKGYYGYIENHKRNDNVVYLDLYCFNVWSDNNQLENMIADNRIVRTILLLPNEITNLDFILKSKS